MTDPARIRNFAIISHIDHGKSTLADRFLELTHAVAERDMREQYLDRMDLERERGITIKAQAVRLRYAADGDEYELNLIDTPGHVDFTYEVSRALAACEGAVLLVDASQGIEAQTLANHHLAELAGLADGELRSRARIRMMATEAESEAEEVGAFAPEPAPMDRLGVGEVGYLVVGEKDVRRAKVGDTITLADRPAAEPLPGYREPKPMVWSGLYPMEGGEYPALRAALDKLRLSDAALVYEPESSLALGFGYRCGFLGLLHMDIVRERMEREFDLSLLSTAPNVELRVHRGAEAVEVHNPSEMPQAGAYDRVEEPVVLATVITPAASLGPIMELCQARRGTLAGMRYLSPERVELRYRLPLAEIIFDFFDQLKSRPRGYASLDYEHAGYQEADLVRVDLLLHGDPVDAFSAVVPRDRAQQFGRQMVERLRDLIPRQLFDVAIQAAIGSRILARETVKARRKDVIAKCYGGDVTRKRKLLEKQKAGKQRMRRVGKVDVPHEAFIAAIRADRGG